MKIGIHQPNYLPWICYFYKISQCDLFIFLDDVQYPGSKITSRNIIRNKFGTQYLSIPIKGRRKLIKDIEIDNTKSWREEHFKTLYYNYHMTSGWRLLSEEIEEIYNQSWKKLSDLNIEFINMICNKLDITTEFVKSSTILKKIGTKSERILNICDYFCADTFISGTGAKEYLNLEDFKKHNIVVEFQEYKIPRYKQKGNIFIENVSVVDFLFECGMDAKKMFYKG